ncbi:hypothetical protein BH10ACT6_BH10ACT6_01280 [soil metagenome]
MSDTSWWVEYTHKHVPMRLEVEDLKGAWSVLNAARERDPLISDVGIYEGGTGDFGTGYRHLGPNGEAWIE